MSGRPLPLLLPLQAAAAIVCLAVLALWPPASGRMLLVPLTGTDSGSTIRPALAAGALLLGSGPVAGSLVVVGERSRIVAATASLGILVFAAPPAGCGTGNSGEVRT